jgi:hypothetical protein
MANESKVLTVGQSASDLDIFLTANGNAVSGQYVGFELFDASNASTVSGVALNPSLGKYVGSGLIPNGQLGDWRVDWTIITLTDNLLTASEPFCVQDVNVAIGFVPSTDKTYEVYEAIRIDIGDPDGLVFDDDFLKRTVTKAVRRLNHRLGIGPTQRPQGIPGGFGGPRLKINPIEFNSEAGTITPNNDEICDLVVMMSEYIIVTAEVSALKRLAATANSGPFATLVSEVNKDGVTVTNADGVTISMSPSRLSNRATLHKFDVETRKKELEMAIRTYLGRMTGNYSKMIY